MQIKGISGPYAPAVEDAREEDRRRKKKDERQKTDATASPDTPAPEKSAAPSAPAEEVPGQAIDSESLVKLLEKSTPPNAGAARAFAKKSLPPADKKKLNKSL